MSNFARGLGIFEGDRREALWLKTQLSRHRPDVILAQYGPVALHLLPVALHYELPLVVHFHGYDMSRMTRVSWYTRRLRRHLQHFAAIVVVATYMRDWLVENGADPNRIHIIPCGSPISDLIPATHAGNTPCRFLMVGRLVEKKGPDLSLKAFAACAASCDNAELTIIGDGPLRERCEQIVREAKIEDRVQWMGVQSNEVVRKTMSESSIFIQHSVTAADGDKEGWPVSIAEAAGSGLPIISTRHAGIVDQVDDGVTGYLVDEGDWQTMADRMIHLAQSPADRVRMGAAARAKMLEYDVVKQVSALEDVLLSAANYKPLRTTVQ